MTKRKPRVIIESPLSGDFHRNTRYARLCCLDSLQRDEAPYASHLIYTQMLNDEIPEERQMGMGAGFAWNEVAELSAVYTDLGISGGMKAGIATAEATGRPVEMRTLPTNFMSMLDNDIPINGTTGAAGEDKLLVSEAEVKRCHTILKDFSRRGVYDKNGKQLIMIWPQADDDILGEYAKLACAHSDLTEKYELLRPIAIKAIDIANILGMLPQDEEGLVKQLADEIEQEKKDEKDD